MLIRSTAFYLAPFCDEWPTWWSFNGTTPILLTQVDNGDGRPKLNAIYETSENPSLSPALFGVQGHIGRRSLRMWLAQVADSIDWRNTPVVQIKYWISDYYRREITLASGGTQSHVQVRLVHGADQTNETTSIFRIKRNEHNLRFA